MSHVTFQPYGPSYYPPVFVPRANVDPILKYIPENQRRTVSLDKVMKLESVLGTSFTYQAEIKGIGKEKAYLEFSCSFTSFLIHFISSFQKEGIQVHFFDCGGGLVDYAFQDIPLRCADYDLFLCIEDPGSWAKIHDIFFRCLEEEAGLIYYDMNGIRTYRQKKTDFTVQIPLPKDRYLPCSLFQYGGLEGLYPSSFEKPSHEHYALFTIPTSFEKIARSIDFTIYSKRENSCITSADCRRIDLLSLLFHRDSVYAKRKLVWAYTVDNYLFDPSINLLERGLFDVQPREQTLKIREGLRGYCKLVTKGLLPLSRHIEMGFCKGFSIQYPEERIKWELEISLGRYLHRHFQNEAALQVLFLLNYSDIVSRSEEIGDREKELTQKIILHLLAKVVHDETVSIAHCKIHLFLSYYSASVLPFYFLERMLLCRPLYAVPIRRKADCKPNLLFIHAPIEELKALLFHFDESAFKGKICTLFSGSDNTVDFYRKKATLLAAHSASKSLDLLIEGRVSLVKYSEKLLSALSRKGDHRHFLEEQEAFLKVKLPLLKEGSAKSHDPVYLASFLIEDLQAAKFPFPWRRAIKFLFLLQGTSSPETGRLRDTLFRHNIHHFYPERCLLSLLLLYPKKTDYLEDLLSRCDLHRLHKLVEKFEHPTAAMIDLIKFLLSSPHRKIYELGIFSFKQQLSFLPIEKLHPILKDILPHILKRETILIQMMAKLVPEPKLKEFSASLLVDITFLLETAASVEFIYQYALLFESCLKEKMQFPSLAKMYESLLKAIERQAQKKECEALCLKIADIFDYTHDALLKSKAFFSFSKSGFDSTPRLLLLTASGHEKALNIIEKGVEKQVYSQLQFVQLLMHVISIEKVSGNVIVRVLQLYTAYFSNQQRIFTLITPFFGKVSLKVLDFVQNTEDYSELQRVVKIWHEMLKTEDGHFYAHCRNLISFVQNENSLLASSTHLQSSALLSLHMMILSDSGKKMLDRFHLADPWEIAEVRKSFTSAMSAKRIQAESIPKCICALTTLLLKCPKNRKTLPLLLKSKDVYGAMAAFPAIKPEIYQTAIDSYLIQFDDSKEPWLLYEAYALIKESIASIALLKANQDSLGKQLVKLIDSQVSLLETEKKIDLELLKQTIQSFSLLTELAKGLEGDFFQRRLTKTAELAFATNNAEVCILAEAMLLKIGHARLFKDSTFITLALQTKLHSDPQ